MQKEKGCIVQNPYMYTIWFLECAVINSASRETRPGFERDCTHLDIHDGSGVDADVLDETADPRRNVEDA